MKKKSLIQFVAVTLIAVVFTLLVKIIDVGFVSSTKSLDLILFSIKSRRYWDTVYFSSLLYLLLLVSVS